MATGLSPAEVLDQSTHEVIAALPIGVRYVPQISFDAMAIFGQGSLADAYLLAISASVLEIAHHEDGELSEDVTPRVQALLEQLATDLADDGSLTPTHRDRLAAGRHRVDGRQVLAHLRQWATWAGVAAVEPPLFAMLDYDDDGVSEAIDNCYGVPNPDQTDEADHDNTPEPCDNCASVPNASQIDSDGDGIGNPCDACPMTPAGQTGPCCDPRMSAIHCREGDMNIQNTGCSDFPSGFRCDDLIDNGTNGYGDSCTGGCYGHGATCVHAGAFPGVAPGTGNSRDCVAGSTCCSRFCTIGQPCPSAGLVHPAVSLSYFAPHQAPKKHRPKSSERRPAATLGFYAPPWPDLVTRDT